MSADNAEIAAATATRKRTPRSFVDGCLIFFGIPLAHLTLSPYKYQDDTWPKHGLQCRV